MSGDWEEDDQALVGRDTRGGVSNSSTRIHSCMNVHLCRTLFCAAMAASRMPAGLLAELRKSPANQVCVDCDTRAPQWATVTYGTLLCLKCSGKHRGMGVHLSFVRSVQMDEWNEKQLRVMQVSEAPCTPLTSLHVPGLAHRLGATSV